MSKLELQAWNLGVNSVDHLENQWSNPPILTDLIDVGVEVVCHSNGCWGMMPGCFSNRCSKFCAQALGESSASLHLKP